MSAPKLSARSPSGLVNEPNSARGGAGHVGKTLSNDDSTLHIPDDVVASGALTARNTSSTNARRKGSPTASLSNMDKKAFEKLQKKKEHTAKHERMLLQREKDDLRTKEKTVRVQQAREQKFKEALHDIQTNDFVRVEAAHIIQQFEMEQEKKRQDLYNEWDQSVSQRIEQQLAKYITRRDPTPRDTGLATPAYREELLPSDNPAKRSLIEQRAEDKFKRIADSIIQGNPSSEGKACLSARIKEREIILETVANRSSCRPVLPVEQWGQQELFAGPYGYFSQRCERMDRGEPFHSTRRMGQDIHRPDEKDGVSAAGKKREKTRNYTNYNHMGMLVGDHCKVGEAYKHKSAHGGGSAVPMQDHYFFEKGNEIVDNEFPVGKRCFPHLKAV